MNWIAIDGENFSFNTDKMQRHKFAMLEIFRICIFGRHLRERDAEVIPC